MIKIIIWQQKYTYYIHSIHIHYIHTILHKTYNYTQVLHALLTLNIMQKSRRKKLDLCPIYFIIIHNDALNKKIVQKKSISISSSPAPLTLSRSLTHSPKCIFNTLLAYCQFFSKLIYIVQQKLTHSQKWRRAVWV